MTRLLTLIIISISVFACRETTEQIQPSQIVGSWFFIDKELDEVRHYNEVRIDSSEIHFHLGNGFTPTFEYEIRQDTLHFTSLAESWPVWVFKEIKTDTLIVEYLERLDNSKRTLIVVRLAKDEKAALDYNPEEWDNPNSFGEFRANAYERRYDEYLIKTGQATWEDIRKWRNDTTNAVVIPITE